MNTFGVDVYDFVVELPYDHSYLVENLADPAHIPISHDRTPGGGKRENAEAYASAGSNWRPRSAGST